MSNIFWKPIHFKKMEKVKSFQEIADIAISVLEGIPDPRFGISAPITTGGFGKENNFLIANKVIEKLYIKGFNTFDITPLEYGIRPMFDKWKKDGGTGYCLPILDVVYRQIFESKLLEIVFLIPGSEGSFGSVWEQNLLKKLGIPILNFPQGWYEEILKNLGLK